MGRICPTRTQRIKNVRARTNFSKNGRAHVVETVSENKENSSETVFEKRERSTEFFSTKLEKILGYFLPKSEKDMTKISKTGGDTVPLFPVASRRA